MLGEANEAVFSPPRKYLTQAHFAVDVNLRMIMNLGRKVGNRSSIQSEKLFFFFRDHHDLGENSKKYRDHHDFGRKKGNTRSKPYFLENIKFWKSLPRAPKFEYSPLQARNNQ